ncbi:SMP-30/gluconolactonase/LRE family protein [Leifsonia sp. NPDC080035]|uniref:SMP-30/gluconolactonase/LRE family protein n=1 Tax=Leifsonia sp. NPDC080035 TaxID=3143936 RepID=A0AAU7GCQ0_9MICO
MTAHRAKRATVETFELGEGPLWDARSGVLRWVDITAGAVLAGTLEADGTIRPTERAEFGETVGAVTLAEDGGLVVVGARRLWSVSADGRRFGGTTLFADDVPARTNDAAVGPDGSLLVGTHALDDDPGPQCLLRVSAGTVTVLDDDLLLSNGLAFSPDGGTLYSIDTLARTVWARDYDPATGATGPRRVHLTTEGMPDGATVDADGGLWIAFWGAAEVRRFAPDGRRTDTVAVPAPNASSVCFAGPGLDTLVITSARQGLSTAELAAHPASGALFTARVGRRGLPEPHYRTA